MVHRILVVSLSVLLLAKVAPASGIPGHVCAATRILAANPGLARLVAGQRPAFLTGAAGPDIAFVASDPKDRSAPGTESHYDRTGDLCVSLLREARTDAERAFALGWITHWLTDIHVHTLVNAYGGNWEEIKRHHRHSQLEVVEAKYVHTTKPYGVKADDLVVSGSSVPSAYVTRAFGAIYPKRAYQGTPPAFTGLLSTAGVFIGQSTQWYREACESGTGKGNSRLMDTVLSAFAARVPTTGEYHSLLKALEIVRLTPATDRVTVRVRVNDAKLFGKFLREWSPTMDAVAAASPAVFGPVIRYLEKPGDAARLAAVRAVLPHIDLDNPLRSPDAGARWLGGLRARMGDGTLRGDPQPTALCVLVEALNRSSLGAPIALTALPASGFDQSRQGEVEATVPLPAGTTHFRLGVALGPPAAFAKPELAGVEWVAAEGDVAAKPGQTGVWMLTKRTVDTTKPIKEEWRTVDVKVGGSSASAVTVETTARKTGGGPYAGIGLKARATFAYDFAWSELPGMLAPGETIKTLYTLKNAGCKLEVLQGDKKYLDGSDAHLASALVVLAACGNTTAELDVAAKNRGFENSYRRDRKPETYEVNLGWDPRQSQPDSGQVTRTLECNPWAWADPKQYQRFRVEVRGYGRYSAFFVRYDYVWAPGVSATGSPTPPGGATGSTPDTRPTTGSSPTVGGSVAAGAPAKLGLCREVRDGTPVDVYEGDRLPRVKRVTCVWRYQNQPAETAVRCVWECNGQELAANTETVSGNGLAAFGLSTKGAAGLPAGRWRVRVVAGGRVLAEREFTMGE